MIYERLPVKATGSMFFYMGNRSVTELKGVGESRAKAFQKLGVSTAWDLARLMPRDYQDFSEVREVANVKPGEAVAMRLSVVEPPQLLYLKKGLQMVTTTLQDETGQIQAIWFNQPYRKKQLQLGKTYIFCGQVDKARADKLINPNLFAHVPGIIPVYPLVKGLSQRHVRDAVSQALPLLLPTLTDPFPEEFRTLYALMGRREALQNVHFPATQEALRHARTRLSFEDMLYYLLAVALLKQSGAGRKGISYRVMGEGERFEKTIPYTLTGAQRRVIREIASDMAAERPMNRLVQGDVGSGKTVLAFFALHTAVQNGYQGVLMAPTEILAQQHYAQLLKTYGERAAAILYGGMKKREREAAYARIANGETRVVVGTHALLQEGVQFENLGLVVTDEQHRFGVRQRAVLAGKGNASPDVLVMSATPIPRTLAMLLYGDLDLSTLDEMPPGRKPIQTRLVPGEKRMDMYAFIERQAQTGRQSYVVCPLVEQSDALDARSAEEVYEELIQAMPSMRIALLHGRMAKAKKDQAVELFRKGELDILVSTSVVEVGVDVPNATIMAIESAERFGLAQLHQLRGRVGRGSVQSYCFLLNTGQAENARLKIMTKTNDGFIIAQKDLELRGPGEFLGTRQHGVDELQSLFMAQSMDVLLLAKRAAEELFASKRKHPDYAGVFAQANEIFQERMRFIANN